MGLYVALKYHRDLYSPPTPKLEGTHEARRNDLPPSQPKNFGMFQRCIK